MKSEIRNRIKQMNNEDIGYERIAKELKISLCAVLYVFSRM